MAFVAINSSSFTLTLKHVERKSDGAFQYRRRIPIDLQSHYQGKKFFVRHLGRALDDIQRKAECVNRQIEADWDTLRGIIPPTKTREPCLNIPAAPETIRKPSPIKPDLANKGLCLTESLSLYLRLHPKGAEKKFRDDNERVVRNLVGRIGDLDLGSISRSHAEDYRDNALRSQSTATVRRNLHSLTAIVNKARKEKQLQILNPFEGLGIIREGEDGTKRTPFGNLELRIIAAACCNLDDDIRHIIALQLDTGCRVAEIVGLRVEDVIISHAIPHVRIRPWGKVRTLKTAASERDIPLVGNALWAAQRAIGARTKATGKDSWLFPRYSSDAEIKATHASATLNKWLRSLQGVSSDKTTHCFRHAIRDRLRAAQVPFEIQECLGGWGTRTIGQGYGNCYPLQVLAEHMRKIVIQKTTVAMLLLNRMQPDRRKR